MPIPDLGIVLFLGIFMIICASALMVVTSPNLVHSAVSLLFTLFGIAAIYIYLYARSPTPDLCFDQVFINALSRKLSKPL